jgi:tetratricopeptide (TPR) repeat protein
MPGSPPAIRSGPAEVEAILAKNGVATDPRTYAQFLAAHDREHALALKIASEERNTRDDLYTEDAYAWALYRTGELRGAREASDKALLLNTPDAMLWYHAGAIRIAQGEIAGGEKLVKKAMDLNPYFDATGRKEALALLSAPGPVVAPASVPAPLAK